ncbi:MAG TPA: hypothetical protein PKK70_02990 [Candidatus Paceibacterota bacterium]|mgnify:CR=1 FL=1|nr:hypothetical protein [Candidatus Paceibacterota bacterium]
MKDLFVWLTVITMTTFIIIYVYQIYKHKIFPALSTWIIFLCGVGLSFVTYIISEKNDLSSGVLNTIDLLNVVVVTIAIILWGKRSLHLKPFEKWYLVAVGLIIFYGIITGDAWSSNILTQVLISVGYFPTIHGLLKSRVNTESFIGWGINLLVSFFALYPASVNGNLLAIIYATRAAVLISVLLIIMVYCELTKKKKLA